MTRPEGFSSFFFFQNGFSLPFFFFFLLLVSLDISSTRCFCDLSLDLMDPSWNSFPFLFFLLETLLSPSGEVSPFSFSFFFALPLKLDFLFFFFACL